MRGRDLDRKLMDMCAARGLLAVHHPDSRQAAPTGVGFVDWVIVGRRIIFREIKGSNDLLTLQQRRAARAIIQAGGDWACWRPGDFFPHGVVAKELDNLMWDKPATKEGE